MNKKNKVILSFSRWLCIVGITAAITFVITKSVMEQRERKRIRNIRPSGGKGKRGVNSCLSLYLQQSSTF